MLGTRRSASSRSISSGLTGRSVRPARRRGPGPPAEHGAQPAALPVPDHLAVAALVEILVHVGVQVHDGAPRRDGRCVTTVDPRPPRPHRRALPMSARGLPIFREVHT